MRSGYFIVSELTGDVCDRVLAIQRQHDPKLARATPPHITLIGSSGAGPIRQSHTRQEVRDILGGAVANIEPFDARFEPPNRFMQTEIVVLPLDPHGPLRALHERMVRSGLTFDPVRFPFSPHCTLSFFRTLTPQSSRALLSVRIEEPIRVQRLQCYLSTNGVTSTRVMDLELGVGALPAARRHA